jgi:hypothetical protein
MAGRITRSLVVDSTPPICVIEIASESGARPQQRLRVSIDGYQKVRYE